MESDDVHTNREVLTMSFSHKSMFLEDEDNRVLWTDFKKDYSLVGHWFCSAKQIFMTHHFAEREVHIVFLSLSKMSE